MEKGNFKIISAPNSALAAEVKAEATVEAEYGDAFYAEGSKITLGHHGRLSANHAPCNTEIDEPLESGTILVSHLDLDAIGGIMAVEGRKPYDPEFWEAAEFIDVHGTHHIKELPQAQQDKLNAYYAAEQRCRVGETPLSKVEITDITERAEKRMHAMDIILDEKHPEHDTYIQQGIEWEAATTKGVEAQHVFDTENVRVFISAGPFTSGSYRCPEDGEIKRATATLNVNRQAVTVAFEDEGASGITAIDVVQGLWGAGAGGKEGIAGSPRGKEMGTKDLLDAAMAVEKAIDPPTRMDRVEELQEMRAALREAIMENVKERGLEEHDTLGAKDAIDKNAITQ